MIVLVLTPYHAAHADALERAGLLHRDASHNNIIVDGNDPKTSCGKLIDWDLCKTLAQLGRGATSHERSVCD